MGDEFAREVEVWLDRLEAELTSPQSPDTKSQDEPARLKRPVRDTHPPGQGLDPPLLSPPSLLTPDRLRGVGLRSAGTARGGVSTRDGREPEPLEKALTVHHEELVRTEKLVEAIQALAREVGVLRRDLDHVKAVLARLRELARARRAQRG